MKKNSIILVYLLVYLLLIIYPQIEKIIFHGNIEVVKSNFIIIDFICQIILVVWIVFVCYKDIKENVINYQFSFKGILNRIWIVISMFIMTFLAMILINLLFKNLGVVSYNEEVLEEFMQLNKVLLSISTICLAPIIEEVIFRWYLFGRMKNNKIYAVLVSSLLFALSHCWIQILNYGVDGIIVMLPYFVTGLALSITYTRTKKIIYPIIFHILWNSINFL